MEVIRGGYVTWIWSSSTTRWSILNVAVFFFLLEACQTSTSSNPMMLKNPIGLEMSAREQFSTSPLDQSQEDTSPRAQSIAENTNFETGTQEEISLVEKPALESDEDSANASEMTLTNLIEPPRVASPTTSPTDNSRSSIEDSLESDTFSAIESSFPLCDGSFYVKSWKEQFDRKWLLTNQRKFKQKKSLKAALEEARSEAFLKLIQPAIGQSSFDFPVVINREVLRWIQYFQTQGRRAFVTWLRRAEDVVPKMIPMLRHHGLPEDLVYLSMIESGFNNRAMSFAFAVGPWQFIRSTGKQYGLRIDDFVDERRDPAKATAAAARFLTDLYEGFGDWHLAAAGYNAGAGRIQRALARAADKKDLLQPQAFFSLAGSGKLPLETSHYVPKLIAAMVIGKDPGRFGFEVAPGSRAIKSEVLFLHKSIDMKDLSKEIAVDVRILRSLNPELRHDITPPLGANRESYLLRVPAAKITQAAAAIEKLAEPSRTQLVVSRSMRRETLSQFARRFGVSLTHLIKSNPKMAAQTPLKKGQIIHVPVVLGSGQFDRLTAETHLQKKFRPNVKRRKNFASKAVRLKNVKAPPKR